MLAEHGFEAASIKEIARAAGVAPGLIHYYFKNKDELLLAVLREASASYTRQMARLSEESRATDLPVAALAVPKDRVSQQPEWYRLRFELFALGLRNPAMTEGLARLLHDGRQGISQVIQAVAPGDPLKANLVASILLACFDGIALQKMADPKYDLDGAYRILWQMARSLLNAPE